MTKVIKYVKENIYVLILGFITLWLRLVNLGYSDYQGDEIKAMFLPEEGQSVAEFLLTQRKGPVQFIITFLLKLVDPTYDHRFLMRLPFAIAGVLAVFSFYKLIRQYFSRKIAFFSAFFLATNGFFVAFSRIIQYQSFVIMFMILALYFFTLAFKKESWKIKGLYLGFLAWSLSILSHYDGVFIGPFVLYTFYRWIKTYEIKTMGQFLKAFILPSLMFTLLLCAFYIPFILELSKSTLSYWKGRIEGTGGKISSSKYLFTVYQPIYVIHIYFALAVLGALRILWKLFIHFKNKNWDRMFLYFSLGVWFVCAITFMEFFVNIPGTHIYTYLISLFWILGMGVMFIYELMKMIFSKIAFSDVLFWLGTGVVFLFIFAQSHQIFVEHGTEYPWRSEKFFVWEFPRPTPIFHLSIFGFPYYRHWDEIGEFVTNSENNGYYSTNERKSIARYHIPFDKDTEEAGHFVYIRNPQSFTNKIIYEKADYWAKHYPPVLSFFKNGEPVVKVFYMPKGSLEEIQEQGF
ncbi:phospholipid carrier-dependent glycosyltransferase [candidate division WWE3 bacterium]|nr:phospholipid carrier-dependent glycosyltransferase [candidate division WWE3 bacterium]